LGRKLIERGAWYFAPASWAWGTVAFCRNKLYDWGWIRQRKVACPVVSVGNIVAGGTGKTPFVLKLAEALSPIRVAILSRGYGKIPDEALLLQRRLPNARVYVGKNRSHLAEQAFSEGAELILLDDGFQHRRLHRDLDIVLLKGDDPFGKGRYLPWGYLRDSPKRLKRADAVFANGPDFRHRVRRIIDQDGKEIPSILGWKVGLFCGVAYPQPFKKFVENLGGQIVSEWLLADHELASPSKLERFAGRCKALEAKALITTEKDIVKGPRCLLPIIYLETELEWLAGTERWVKLIEKIRSAIDNRPTYGGTDKNSFT